MQWGLTFKVGTNIKPGINLNEGTNNGTNRTQTQLEHKRV